MTETDGVGGPMFSFLHPPDINCYRLFIIHQLIRARKLIIVGLYSVFLASIYSEGKCSSLRKVLERDEKDVYRSG